MAARLSLGSKTEATGQEQTLSTCVAPYETSICPCHPPQSPLAHPAPCIRWGIHLSALTDRCLTISSQGWDLHLLRRCLTRLGSPCLVSLPRFPLPHKVVTSIPCAFAEQGWDLHPLFPCLMFFQVGTSILCILASKPFLCPRAADLPREALAYLRYSKRERNEENRMFIPDKELNSLCIQGISNNRHPKRCNSVFELRTSTRVGLPSPCPFSKKTAKPGR